MRLRGCAKLPLRLCGSTPRLCPSRPVFRRSGPSFTLAWLRMFSFSDCKRARVLISELLVPEGDTLSNTAVTPRCLVALSTASVFPDRVPDAFELAARLRYDGGGALGSPAPPPGE